MLALTLAAAVGASAVLFLFNPAEHAFYPLCLFHQLTGLHCPGCGGLRAAHQLLHGHPLAALRLNALAVGLLPCLAVVAGREFANRRHGVPGRSYFGTRWIWAFIAVLVAFTVLRNLSPFAFLAP